MNKKNHVLIVLSVLFMLGGVLAILASLNTLRAYPYTNMTEGALNAKEHALSSKLEKEHIQKLEQNGRLEEFQIKFEQHTSKFAQKTDRFRRWIVPIMLASVLAGFVAGAGLLASGVGLLRAKPWARKLGILAVLMTGVFYLLFALPLYLSLDTIQYMCVSGHELSLIYGADHDDFAQCARQDFVNDFFFGPPFVILHGLVLVFVAGSLWVLRKK